MTVIKKTFEYIIESEPSERIEQRGNPEILFALGLTITTFSVVVYFFLIFNKTFDAALYGVIAGMLLMFTSGFVKLFIKPTVIQTLKITLSEIHSSGKLEGKPIFSTCTWIDLTKDIDELARRLQAAIDTLIARREYEIFIRLAATKKETDKKACIADLEKQALEKLK